METSVPTLQPFFVAVIVLKKRPGKSGPQFLKKEGILKKGVKRGDRTNF